MTEELPKRTAFFDREINQWVEDQPVPPLEEPKTFSLPPAYISAVTAAIEELSGAINNWPTMNSAHEGYGVLYEEVIELRNHVFTNQKRRDLTGMRKEAIQVAAMALRFAAEVTDEINGRK